MKLVGTFGVVALLGVASSALALPANLVGPRYPVTQQAGSPVSGSCTASGNACTTGATVTCTGLNANAFNALYFGIRNDQFVNGVQMTGLGNPVAATNQFKISSAAGATIIYTGTTTVQDQTVGHGAATVTTRLTLTVTGVTGGTATIVPTGNTPAVIADNNNSQIQNVFQLSSTVTGLTMTATIQASDAFFGLQGSCPFFDASHARGPATDNTHSSADVGFYYTTVCGDSIVSVGEACDTGGTNGTAASCCSVGCQFNGSGTACTDDGLPCTDDTCNGGSAVCQHPNSPTTRVCRAAAGECDLQENCTGAASSCPADAKKTSGTACTADANPCSLDQCDGSNVLCQHPAGNSGAVCRGSAGVCDPQEVCTGASTTCPADAKSPSTTSCRGAVNQCDLQENCTGSGDNCPTDVVKTAGTACTDDGNVCTTDLCNGIVATVNCIHNPGNPGTVCRAGSNDPNGSGFTCDPNETCTGASSVCPADVFSVAGTTCRTSAGLCDPAETCTGVALAPCGTDAKSPTTTICRGSGGVCDIIERCNGVSNSCPADAVEASTTTCRTSAGVCDPAEFCDGSGKLCGLDSKSPNGTLCRSVVGVCDAEEDCDGSGNNCPADVKLPTSTECRASGGFCDLAENCDGTTNNCPADAKKATSVECRSVAGTCDLAENCDGTNNLCPTDLFKATSVICRTGSGDPNSRGFICDPDENCTGSGATCPMDTIVAAGTTCNAGTDAADASREAVCDPKEVCDGVATHACPVETVLSTATICDTGTTLADGSRDQVCDPDEHCTGIPDQPCPADTVRSTATVCDIGSGNPNGGDLVCDPDEHCTGIANQPCPVDTFALGTTVCNAGSDAADATRDDICDPREFCPGTANGPCPVDIIKPTSTVCDIGSGNPNGGDITCDPDEHCTGIHDKPCPVDTFASGSVVCNAGTNAADAGRDAGVICDPQEFCPGSPNAPCPVDFRESAGTVCDIGSSNPNGGAVCDPDEACTGNPDQPCPSDQFSNANVVCRTDAGDCDIEEKCPGSPNQACPVDAFEPAPTACGNHDDTECTNPDTCDGFGTCLSNHEVVDTQCFGPATYAQPPVPIELGNNCTHACDGTGFCVNHITPNCCGNGIVEGGEQCDDMNQYSGSNQPAPDGSVESGCPSDFIFHCSYSAAGLLIRGNRLNPTKDKKGCQVEFFTPNPNNPPDRFGKRNYAQTCLDNDPSCDFDSTPGRCGFKFTACVNVSDPNLPACDPGVAGNNGMSELGILPYRGALHGNTVANMFNAANTAAITTAVTHLFDPLNPGSGFTNSVPINGSSFNMCSEPQTLTVFAASAKPNESARARFTLRAKSKDGKLPKHRMKRSLLRLTCLARKIP